MCDKSLTRPLCCSSSAEPTLAIVQFGNHIRSLPETVKEKFREVPWLLATFLLSIADPDLFGSGLSSDFFRVLAAFVYDHHQLFGYKEHEDGGFSAEMMPPGFETFYQNYQLYIIPILKELGLGGHPPKDIHKVSAYKLDLQDLNGLMLVKTCEEFMGYAAYLKLDEKMLVNDSYLEPGSGSAPMDVSL